MFVVIRLRKEAEVIKDWYGLKAVESLNPDLFEFEFKIGTLDRKSPIILSNPIVTPLSDKRKPML